MNNKNLIWKVLSACLLVCTVVTFVLNGVLRREVDSLQLENKVLKDKEKKSYVVQRISEQMEDIAYQQKDISDRQREAAIYQMGVADSMRVRAEEGENKARAEQRKAQQYALNLEEARNVAEHQRQVAVEQQQLAEHAKNVADTLSFISLARSLAANSEMQYQSGDKDLSALLAYMSWAITAEFNGNVFYPSIFNALSLNSKAFLSRKVHKGGVTRIVPFGTESEHVSISKYGEVCLWNHRSGVLDYSMLVNNPLYDFRDVYIDKDKTIYALSYNGWLVKVHANRSIEEILLPEGFQWVRVAMLDDDRLLLVSTDQLHVYSKSKKQMVKQISLNGTFTAMGQRNGNYILFCANGRSYELKGEILMRLPDVLKDEAVTAYVWMYDRQEAAVGTENGNIYLLDKENKVTEKLVGHQSKITHIVTEGPYLYSSSYDRDLNLWDLNQSKREALTLTRLPSWIYSFSYSIDTSIWIGDESGTVSRIMTSPNDMGKMVRKGLKRDFTIAEWEYFFGTNIPQVSLKLE